MLIEDCEADNYLHQKMIKDVGAAREVMVMRSGNDALVYFRTNSNSVSALPELVFLDINTPGMEGWDFIDAFGKLDEHIQHGTIIIMLSGSLNPDDRDRAEQLPLIREYRSKPLTREALTEIMETHFWGQPASGNPQMVNL